MEKIYVLVIENASVLTMDGAGTFLEDGVIGVENGVITLLGEKAGDSGPYWNTALTGICATPCT